MFRNVLRGLCLFLYLLSALLALLIVVKVVEVRSKCTKERARISSLVSEIKELKEQNNRLMVEYYETVRPELFDKATKELKILHENEVKYIK